MFKRGYKLIISVVLISALFIGFNTCYASAASVVDDIKSTYYAAALAMQLILNPINIVLDSPATQAIDPLGKHNWVETLPEYLDRSVIKVVPDAVTIDGVQYSELWLGPEAADKLRLGVLDIASLYNIINNQADIEYASGAGYLGDLPAYNIDSVIRTQAIFVDQVPYSVPRLDDVIYSYGVNYIRSHSQTDSTNNIGISPTGSSWYYGLNIQRSYYPVKCYYERDNGVNYFVRYFNGGANRIIPSNAPITFTEAPFSFDYTSGVIDAPIAEDDGLLFRVPSTYTNPDPQVVTYNYDIHDLINVYPDVIDGKDIVIDPELNPDYETDIELGNDVGDLIWKIIAILSLLNHSDIEFAPEPEPQPEPEPTAPPSPVPSTPISDQPGEWLDEILRWIQETITSVKNATQTLGQTLERILEQVETLPQEIMQDIETAPIDIYRRSLEIIKTVFAPVLLLLRSVIGLWHYVVEWVQATAPVFSSFFGFMSGTSYNMVLPIYASLAGPIVIAVYKRFGK